MLSLTPSLVPEDGQALPVCGSAEADQDHDALYRQAYDLLVELYEIQVVLCEQLRQFEEIGNASKVAIQGSRQLLADMAANKQPISHHSLIAPRYTAQPAR